MHALTSCWAPSLIASLTDHWFSAVQARCLSTAARATAANITARVVPVLGVNRPGTLMAFTFMVTMLGVLHLVIGTSSHARPIVLVS